MKTEIQAFCSDFAEKIEPFSASLDETLAALTEKTDFEPLKKSALRLQEVRHRLCSLEEKIEGQQAYLLIFGPLKSGKSTLMNAISGSYVSEVSSLPAYPALVYVKNGKETTYEATTYEGKKINFSNNQEMGEAVQEGHRELARKILEVERDGENFDPPEHFPEAIRRMDVEIPAKNLGDSGSVLVDTPGLYSRMRFGYDLMTRDFRDTAACAIFVVKTDNLFFEKVFEEFNQLLNSFSRIFLVANIDMSKKDLAPDGSLKPSVESTEPQKIIKAFQSLSMSAPLREAFEDGRLKVYPIDLLRAASQQLKAAQEELEEAADEDQDDTINGFDDFLNDLTDYLNSSDYLHEFMYDSLRFGADLSKEATQVIIRDAEDQLQDYARQLTERLEQIRVKRDALETLEKTDWQEIFDVVYSEKERLLLELSEKNSKRLSRKLQECLDAWMQDDTSLQTLQKEQLNPLIESETQDDASVMREQLRQLLDDSFGGARFSTEQVRAFQKTEIEIGQIIPRLLTNLGQEANPQFHNLEFDPEAIPVKKTFLDFLLFRNQQKVQNLIFGSEGELSVPAKRKQKRLVGEGLEALKSKVADYPNNGLARNQKEFLTEILDQYVENFKQTMLRHLASLRERLDQRSQDMEVKLAANQEIQRICSGLQSSARDFSDSISVLKGRYHAEAEESETEDETTEPAESDHSIPFPAESSTEDENEEEVPTSPSNGAHPRESKAVNGLPRWEQS